ncbi:MAG: hypothetical protein ACOZAQ_03100 [Pseudomonadota bacterium]
MIPSADLGSLSSLYARSPQADDSAAPLAPVTNAIAAQNAVRQPSGAVTPGDTVSISPDARDAYAAARSGQQPSQDGRSVNDARTASEDASRVQAQAQEQLQAQVQEQARLMQETGAAGGPSKRMVQAYSSIALY